MIDPSSWRGVAWWALRAFLAGLLAAAFVFLVMRAFAAQRVDGSSEPYSCQLLHQEQRKCAFNSQCDRRTIERLTRECLRDGGHP
jgi:hypothetical protein